MGGGTWERMQECEGEIGDGMTRIKITSHSNSEMCLHLMTYWRGANKEVFSNELRLIGIIQTMHSTAACNQHAASG